MELNPNKGTFLDMIDAARAEGVLQAHEQTMNYLLGLEASLLTTYVGAENAKLREGMRMVFAGMRVALEQNGVTPRQQYEKELALAEKNFAGKHDKQVAP